MLGKFKSLREALTRTRQTAFGRVATLLGQTEITPDLWDDLEALLIQADVGVETTGIVLDHARARVKADGITRADKLKDILKQELRAMLVTPEPIDWLEAADLRVVLIVGTNGSGKTTSIAKLAVVVEVQSPIGLAGRRRYLPRGGGRSIGDLGRSGGCAHHRRATGRGSRLDRV